MNEPLVNLFDGFLDPSDHGRMNELKEEIRNLSITELGLENTRLAPKIKEGEQDVLSYTKNLDQLKAQLQTMEEAVSEHERIRTNASIFNGSSPSYASGFLI